MTLSVESFAVTEITASDRLNNGHYTNTIAGEVELEAKKFPIGTYYVSTAQPLANVAAYLLEPESDDGLVFWNFFDRYLAPQFGGGSRTYPVHKLFEPANLVKETIAR